MTRKALQFGRYDYAAFTGSICFALCSLSIPLMIVEIGDALAFPLDRGGMAAGGLLHLFRSVAMVAALLLCGNIAGRIGKRRSMGGSLLCMGAGTLLCAFAPQYWMLIPWLLIAGFGEGICEGIATPFVQDLHPDAPERYVNIAHSFWSIGIAVVVVVVGGLWTLGAGWRAILAGIGIVTLLASALFLWRENPRRKYPEAAGGAGFREIAHHALEIARVPRFWLCSLAMFFGAGAEFGLTFWSAAYVQLNFQTGAWVAGLGTGAVAFGMFLGRSGFGFFARPDYIRYVLLGSALCTIPVTLLLALLKPGILPPALGFPTLFLLLILAGTGVATFWPSVQVYGVTTMPELDSTMLYICFSALGIPGCGIFTLLMGVIGDRYGLRGGILVIPVCLALFAAVIFLECWVFAKRRKNSGTA
ncbi:sugar MFS transporter [uncultured Victivallis sp.]|uniref:MFS transporter n=1 Tax=uncultured Victivallis sp. TaxID=354118 RepID=UPI0025D22642|nr:MFS transporter [uncultured Victivallis sp.]